MSLVLRELVDDAWSELAVALSDGKSEVMIAAGEVEGDGVNVPPIIASEDGFGIEIDCKGVIGGDVELGLGWAGGVEEYFESESASERREHALIIPDPEGAGADHIWLVDIMEASKTGEISGGD